MPEVAEVCFGIKDVQYPDSIIVKMSDGSKKTYYRRVSKMTNYEKYKDDIIKTLFIKGNIKIDKKTGELRACWSSDYCKKCQFDGDCRSDTLRKWLDSEYVEPKKEEVDWSKVMIGTPVLVSDDNEIWWKRHFAYYRDKRIWVFNNGLTSWTVNDLSEVNGWKYGKLLEDR